MSALADGGVRVTENCPHDDLQEHEQSRPGGGSSQTRRRLRDRIGRRLPGPRREKSEADEQAEHDLREAAMNHREIGPHQSVELDAEAAEQALQYDGDESDGGEPF